MKAWAAQPRWMSHQLCRGEEPDHRFNEHQLSDLDVDIEEQQSERNNARRAKPVSFSNG